MTFCATQSSLPGPMIDRARGMLGCHVIAVRAIRQLGGELQHLGAQRGDHRRRRLGGRRCLIRVLAHRGEIVAEGRYRLAVGVSAHAADHRRVADAHAEQEPACGCSGRPY